MKPKEYDVLIHAVENGVAYGIHRAFKHTDNPNKEDLQETISESVMNEICSWFEFDNEEKE